MNRRQDVIDAAVALLREDGPDALTTVAVAARLGITQSAIYRHVHNVDELASLASRQVVAELEDRIRTAILGVDLSWGDAGVTRQFADLIVSVVTTDLKSFEIIDRWRYAEGELGSGIRDMMSEGTDLCCTIIEAEWRSQYGYSKKLTPVLRTVQRTYADLIADDVIRVARLVRDGGFPGGRNAIARILELRLLAGYTAYATDMNSRLGLEIVLN